jgi:2-polyprenyl-3-methyl-5-hydroxy-6-metoxy-1,4-benzoquinol methylase
MSSGKTHIDTGKLYDQHASRWQRREPSSLSDFTGRPPVFELCGDVSGLDIIDLGCGEGYCSRELAGRGAGSVTGVELSNEMVQIAKAQDAELGQGITYRQGDVTSLSDSGAEYDLAIGVFVYNYLTTEQMLASFKEVYRVLKPGGQFVFSVPHPAFAFIRSQREKPFFFDVGDAGYFSGRNIQHNGEIYRRNGTALPVQMVHKTVSDYFDGLRRAGFCSMPEVKELSVIPEHLELDQEFFSPVADLPLHMAFKITR